jgi:uncharacterized protein YgiM (DUF1202 family)
MLENEMKTGEYTITLYTKTGNVINHLPFTAKKTLAESQQLAKDAMVDDHNVIRYTIDRRVEDSMDIK